MPDRPIICFDFETSNFIPDGGQPIEFAAILMDPHTLLPVQENAEFHYFMRLEDGEAMGEGAEKVHGISREKLQRIGFPRAQVKELFFKWLESHGFTTPLEGPDWKKGQVQGLGQNIHFDIGFWELWLGEDFKEFLHFKYLDCMPIAAFINMAFQWSKGYEHLPFRHPDTDHPSVSLISQAHSFGLPIDGAHGALFDTRTTAEVWRLHVVHLSETLDQVAQNYQAEDRDRHLKMTGRPAGQI